MLGPNCAAESIISMRNSAFQVLRTRILLSNRKIEITDSDYLILSSLSNNLHAESCHTIQYGMKSLQHDQEWHPPQDQHRDVRASLPESTVNRIL